MRSLSQTDPSMAGRRLTERILDLVEEQEKKSGSGQTRRTVTRPMVVFPEGTTSNGSFLLSFKTGAFRAGQPVLPVLFQYRAVTVHPGWESITFKNHLGKLITAPWNRVAVHTLPTYYPSEAEQHDAKLYANNVHKFMVEYSRGYPETFGAAGLLASTASFKDKMTLHHVLRHEIQSKRVTLRQTADLANIPAILHDT